MALGVITRLGPYTDREHISLGLTDTLICFEMPFFAAAHMYAFSYRDFIQPPPSTHQKGGALMFVARMQLGYAFRDAFGLKDLVEDTRTTLRGEGINYRAFEPTEGSMHIGAARERRIRAGLRYSAGGKRKYWLPEVRGLGDAAGHGENDIVAPLLAEEAEGTVSEAPDILYQYSAAPRMPGDDVDAPDDDEYALRFSDALAGPNGADEILYEHAKKYVFGDFLYPVVDVSSKEARRVMWEEEARVVRENIYAISGREEDKLPAKSTSMIGYGATEAVQRTPVKHEDAVDEAFSPQERAVDLEGGSSSIPGSMIAWSKSDIKGKLSSPASSHRSAGTSHLQSATQPSSSSSRPQPRTTSPSTSGGSERHIQAPSTTRSAHATHYLSRSKKSRAPLAKDDAVDLVISAHDGRHKSSSSPTLIRIWNESSTPQANHSQVQVEHAGSDILLSDNDKPASPHQEYLDAAEEDDGARNVVRAQTPPPYAQGGGYYYNNTVDEDNPWA